MLGQCLRQWWCQRVVLPASSGGTPATLVAEMQARSRRAFNKHRGTLMSEARVKDRLQMHTILVRQSALWCCETWPCLEFILKSANSVQLLQARAMLKQPRPVGELWADWHTRSMRGTRSMLHRCKIERWSTDLGPCWARLQGGPCGRRHDEVEKPTLVAS